MLFNIIFKQYLNIFIRNFVLCIQIRFVSTEKTTRIASRASCLWMYTVSSYWLPVLTVECELWTRDLRVLYNITGKIKEDNYGANYN